MWVCSKLEIFYAVQGLREILIQFYNSLEHAEGLQGPRQGEDSVNLHLNLLALLSGTQSARSPHYERSSALLCKPYACISVSPLLHLRIHPVLHNFQKSLPLIHPDFKRQALPTSSPGATLGWATFRFFSSEVLDSLKISPVLQSALWESQMVASRKATSATVVVHWITRHLRSRSKQHMVKVQGDLRLGDIAMIIRHILRAKTSFMISSCCGWTEVLSCFWYLFVPELSPRSSQYR